MEMQEPFWQKLCPNNLCHPRGSPHVVEYRLSTRKGVSEGLILDLSSAESTTAVKVTGPNITAEPLTTISLYGGLVYFAIVRNLRFGTRQQLLRSTYCARSPESEFRLSRRVQPTQRQDVLAQPGSAVFSRRSDQQTEPQCGSLEDKLLKAASPTVRELSLERRRDHGHLSL